MICKHIFEITFLNDSELIFLLILESFAYTQLNYQTVVFQTIEFIIKLNGSKYYYVLLTTMFGISEIHLLISFFHRWTYLTVI